MSTLAVAMPTLCSKMTLISQVILNDGDFPDDFQRCFVKVERAKVRNVLKEDGKLHLDAIIAFNDEIAVTGVFWN